MANTAQPSELVSVEALCALDSPLMATVTSGWPASSRLKTWTASVPLLPPADPTGGASSDSSWAESVRLPTVVDVTTVRRRR